jgi:hypothetical protein
LVSQRSLGVAGLLSLLLDQARRVGVAASLSSFLWFQLAGRKTSSNIHFTSGVFPYEPCRWLARLKAESELLTGAANAIVKT